MAKYLSKPFTLAFFDFDGVILESEEPKNRAMIDFFRQFPDQSQAMIDFHYAHPDRSRHEKLRHLFQLMPSPPSRDVQAQLTDQLNNAMLKAVVESPEVEGARELLGALKESIPVVLVSATPRDALLKTLARRKLQGYFAEVYGIPPQKSASIRRVLDDRGVPGTESFLVGDSTKDQEAARDNDVVFIGRKRKGTAPFHRGSFVEIDNLTQLLERMVFHEPSVSINMQGMEAT